MDDGRFVRPLFNPTELSHFLRVPRRSLRDWLDAPVGTLPRDEYGLSIPFAGLLEARVVMQLRAAGLKLQAIRDANVALRRDLGRPHPLIWKHLAHDGKDILRPFEGGWLRGKDQQHGLPEVIEFGLRKVMEWQGDYPSRIQLDGYGEAEVVSDPDISGGHPVHWASGVRVEDIVGLVRAGDSVDVAAKEFRIPPQEVQELVLADYRHLPRAA